MSIGSTQLRSIPISAIVLSKTASQVERRKHLDKGKLQELADSIKSHGLVQPILVRPINGGDDDFELVAGERRLLAAQLAKINVIAATVRELTDEQVLELQLIENLQRQDLHELAEAEGYEALQKLGHSIDDMATKVGKSKATIYARMKLLALGKTGRSAFYEGKISASVALLVSRIPVESLQIAALKEILNDGRYGGEMSYRDAADFIQQHYMLRLDQAPFPITDADLVKGALPCAHCPKNTIVQPELFEDVKKGSAGVCTDPTCFAAKKEAHVQRAIAAAKASGQTVLEGKAAKEVFPHGTYNASAGFVKLDETRLANGEYRKVGAIVGKGAETVLVKTADGELIPVVKDSQVKAAMKAKGLTGATSSSSSSADKKAKVKRAAEQAFRHAVLAQIVKRAPIGLSRQDLELVATELFTGSYGADGDELFAAMGWPLPTGKDWKRHAKAFEAKMPKLSGVALNGLILYLVLASAVGNQTFDGGHTPLERTASRLHIDLAAIRKELANPTLPSTDQAIPVKKTKAARKPK